MLPNSKSEARASVRNSSSVPRSALQWPHRIVEFAGSAGLLNLHAELPHIPQTILKSRSTSIATEDIVCSPNALPSKAVIQNAS